MTQSVCKVFILFIMVVGLSGCSEKDENSGSVNNVGGIIEKGPFLTGSKVILYELDETLSQTGKNFKTETVNDKGEFIFPGIELSGRYAELEISGYFYNEVEGRRSRSQIRLNAITGFTDKKSANVNILTHLEFKRVKKLMKEGKSFADAKKTAERELLKVFHILTEFKNPEQIGLTDGDENAAMLLAVSSVLLYGKTESEFSEFISKLSNEFAENGAITDELLLEEIFYGETNVDALSVTDHLKAYYKTQGTEIVIGNIRKYIDGNGDGILDEKDETIGDEDKDNPSVIEPEENHWKDEQSCRGYMESIHASVSDYFQLMAVSDALRCKQATIPGMQISPDNVLIGNAWERAYVVMRMIHTLMEQDYSSSGFDVKPYLCSVRLLRSCIYLDMVQHWGKVPLVTRRLDLGDKLDIPRTPKEEVLAFVINELKTVLPDLPDTSEDNLLASKDWARAILANAMLEKEAADYQEAAAQLKAIVNRESYALLGREQSIYTENNREEIFSLKLTESAVSSYFEELIRQEGTLHPIYRFTGIVLNDAEALYRLGKYDEALVQINKVRTSLKMAELPSLPSGEICAEIADLWEKAIGKDYGYFVLLRRLDLAVSRLGIQQYETLYPVPMRELILNAKMDQNPGYKKSLSQTPAS